MGDAEPLSTLLGLRVPVSLACVAYVSPLPMAVEHQRCLFLHGHTVKHPWIGNQRP